MDRIIDDTILGDIATAIRTKTGTTEQIAPTQMADAINGIQSGGDSALLAEISSIVFSRDPAPYFRIPGSPAKIGGSAFRGINVTHIVIPDSVENIINEAFSVTQALETVTFEGTPIFISSGAFSNDKNLTVINVPWSEGAVNSAPWGATNAVINYNSGG